MHREPRPLPKLCLLVLWGVLGCSRQHDGRSSKTEPDSNPSVSEDEPDAKDEPPEPDDLRGLVHDVFTELQRDAELRCHCYVASGDYPSEDECLAEVGRGQVGTECLEKALGDTDSNVLRTQLECMLDARQTTNACLETAGCDEQLTRCYENDKECPSPDPILLTHASRECPGAIGLPR